MMPDKASKGRTGPNPKEGTPEYRNSPPAHAYGEGGPEKMSGSEGPNTKPQERLKKEKE